VPELRAVETTSLLGLTGTTLADDAISARTAQTVATFSACVQLIASSMAYLPSRVYRAGRTRTEVMENPLYRLMREGPNPLQTWPDFIEAMVAQVLLNGNALAAIEADGSGNLIALRFIPWGWVAPVLLPSGRLAYDVTEGSAMLGAVGRRYRLLAGEVLHLKDRSDDGLLGVSRLRRAASTVIAAKTTNEFAAKFIAGGAAPSGAFSFEGRIPDEQKSWIRQQLEHLPS
jgi:HK97 family phage portal protein